ncbi:MAG: leucyl aminopeptidase family protein [Bacteroidota bacterium]|nr:leucyl aminopeptidase family protein [Bacteroidota bacterium]
MQKLNIGRAKSYSYDENLVILIDKKSDLKELDLTSQETEFVKKELENKASQVALNRYSNWVVVQTSDLSKDASKVKEALRKGGNSVCQLLQKQKATKVTIVDKLEKPELVLAFVEGLALANYQFVKYQKDAGDKTSTLTDVAISGDVTDDDIQKLSSIVEAVCIARDLINEPASVLTSVKLSEEIQELGKEAGFSVEVLDKAKIEALKMGGLLAVNQGSTQPPTFTILEWKPEGAVNAKPIVLVGKGVVYDTGGYSLKPTPNSMDYMKCDMAGAAAVAATFYALAKTGLPVYVVGLIPSTDNRLSADAYSPGDIITISDGTTVEVLNTDAEGRLILADALVYAQKYDPELVFTIATLTGAAHRAIGELGTVGMGNVSTETEKKIVDAGYDVYERIAVFPFWEEYDEMIKSDIADLKNIGGEVAGAITAGKFLEHFTNSPYFHLDIAGPAFLKKPNSYRGLGGTGTGVRLFYRFLEQLGK